MKKIMIIRWTMMGGTGWAMGIVWFLIPILSGLGIGALVKYVFFK